MPFAWRQFHWYRTHSDSGALGSFNVLYITIAIVASVLIAGFYHYRVSQKETLSKAIFDGYVASVVDTATEGERVYRAQIASLGGTPTNRGIALSRLATALFPVAAYAISEISGGLSPDVAKYSPVSGKTVWNVASGAALQPFGDTHGIQDLQTIKEDTNFSINQFVELMNEVNVLSPNDAIGPAISRLSPIWQRALEISGAPNSERAAGYASQYVTSGMHQLADVFGLLTNSRS